MMSSLEQIRQDSKKHLEATTTRKAREGSTIAAHTRTLANGDVIHIPEHERVAHVFVRTMLAE